LRLRGKFRNITLISAYAPTEGSPDAIKDELYDQLRQVCEKAGKYEILILLVDFNTKIGKENSTATAAGKHTLREVTSENGKRLRQLAARHNIIIKSTYFEQKRIHKGTWMCPGNDVVNQIDHAVRHASSINPLACTAVRETAGLARSINTQPAVRWSEPSMSFAFNSSLLSVDSMTCLIPFES
jgi:hypothetical protein